MISSLRRMLKLATLFTSLGAVLYTWLGYPAILVLMARLVGKEQRSQDGELPSVTFLITVHNGKKIIAKKLDNTLGLDYPRDKLQILVASDGSHDGTDDAVRLFSDQGVEIFSLSQQAGKSATQNAAILHASRGEIIVFSNADTMCPPRFLRHLVRPFSDTRCGVVGGHIRWVSERDSSITVGSGFYWALEIALWRRESALGVMCWAPGAGMAVRRSLFRPVPPEYGEDCIVPLDVVEQGFRVVFAPDAEFFEPRIATVAEEFHARVRMTLRSFGGTLSKQALLNPIHHPLLVWAIASHKLLRWLTPYFLLALLRIDLDIAQEFRSPSPSRNSGSRIYTQAVLGYALERRGQHALPLPVRLCSSFGLTNAAFLAGTWKLLRGRRQRVF